MGKSDVRYSFSSLISSCLVDVIGVCAMKSKATSKPMKSILNRLVAYNEIDVVTFDEELILTKGMYYIHGLAHCNSNGSMRRKTLLVRTFILWPLPFYPSFVLSYFRFFSRAYPTNRCPFMASLSHLDIFLQLRLSVGEG